MSLLPSYMDEIWRCFEDACHESFGFIDVALVSTDPQKCSSRVLPFLAWECDVDISGVDETTARSVIRAAFDAMQYAGTIKALRGPVEALSDNAKVTEWFEYGGSSYNFKVEIDSSQRGLSEILIQKLENTAIRQKNVRSHLESIKINMLSRCNMNNLLSTTSGESCAVYPYFPEPIEMRVSENVGSAYHDVDTTIIYPKGA